MRVKKRDGKFQKYNSDKIRVAIIKAAEDVEQEVPEYMLDRIVQRVTAQFQDKSTVTTSEISNLVENQLMSTSYKDVARAYIENRHLNDMIQTVNTTDKSILQLLSGDNDYWNKENSNKNARLVTTQRDYIAGIASTDLTRRYFLDKDIVKAHDEAIIHFHDADYFLPGAARHNCELINLDDMLQNGTVINGVKIEKPHRFITAMTIATQIIVAVSSSSYGGATVTMTHLAPFVRDSYNRYLQKYKSFGLDDNLAKSLADQDIKKEVSDGVQTFNYQVNSMSTTNGQAPFLSVNLDISETDEYKYELSMIIEEFFRQRILGMKNEQGVYITVAFPKLLYVLCEENIHKDSPYWYLTELAAKCTAKRMVPDYISKKKMSEYKINKFGTGDCYPCMGCRSFLTPWRTKGNPSKALNYSEDKPKYYGRFNAGVVTLNLPDVALSAEGDMKKFWEIFDERAELIHRALKLRLKSLETTHAYNAPILWQHGALARLNPDESIAPLLKDGYATISFGYAGLYECVKAMTGKSHTDGAEGEAFGLSVMQAMNDKCSKWKKEENVDYSVYGTPIETTTYKFAKGLKKRFGEDVFVKLDGKDRDYITNSYHVWVEEKIDPFEKIRIEARFQKLSPGGAISYIETADLTKNIDSVLQVIQYIYDNIVYAELNTKSDYCQVCGYDGEIQIVENNGELLYHCPNCGNEDFHKMNIARRVCGYISTNEMNQGRMDEIAHRYVHLDNHVEEII